jgi:hypothetical protein
MRSAYTGAMGESPPRVSRIGTPIVCTDFQVQQPVPQTACIRKLTPNVNLANLHPWPRDGAGCILQNAGRRGKCKTHKSLIINVVDSHHRLLASLPAHSNKRMVRKQFSCKDFVITIRKGRHQFSWHKKQEHSRIFPSDTVVVLTLHALAVDDASGG